MQNNKVFLYMVIHDLKHPTQSLISQLSRLQDELLESRAQIRRLELVVENLNSKLLRMRPRQLKEVNKKPSTTVDLRKSINLNLGGVNQIVESIDRRKKITLSVIEQSVPRSIELLDDEDIDVESNEEDLEEAKAVPPNSTTENRTSKTVF